MKMDEFEQDYANRSGLTVEWLHSVGLFAMPCECGEASCPGWRMSTKQEYREETIISSAERIVATLYEESGEVKIVPDITREEAIIALRHAMTAYHKERTK